MNPDDEDGRDPLRAAFDDHQRPPADVVPRARLEHSTADLESLAGTTQAVTHYEMTADGITKHTERVEICAPITERNTER